MIPFDDGNKADLNRRSVLALATGAAIGAAAPIVSQAAAASVRANDIVMLNAVALGSAIHTRQVSCVEVMTAYLLNPKVKAIVACAAFALASWTLPALAQAPYPAVKQACDNMNKQKAGSCKMEPLKWMAGCAGNACFECPIDGRRLCFPRGNTNTQFVVRGNDGQDLVVRVVTAGTNVEAVLKGCDTFANQNRGTCDYNRTITRGVIGATANTKFVCLDTTSATNCTGNPPK
jgi:hypothetical protein